MISFRRPNGRPFDCDYEGPIHAFDSGNDLIAICRGTEIIELDDCTCDSEYCDCDLDCFEYTGDPCSWCDWEVVVFTTDDAAMLLMQAIATAYNALLMCERVISNVSI